MASAGQDFVSLALLVFALGLRHGFDADHLATIDGLTRYNARANPRLARLCGTLFSLGHGAVVVAIALLVSLAARQWNTPEWLNLSGAWISIGFLVLLGMLNLRAALTTPPAELVAPVGVKGRLLGRLNHVRHPLLVALVGALFALSFDTVSQAALFALTASQFGGWQHALTLGLVFMLGMLVTDGINGLWIARLIRRADETALVASRVLALAVGGMSLLVAAFGAAKQWLPAVETWSEGKELALGLTVVAVILASFAMAVRLTRPAMVPQRGA
ncbi:MAG: nickel transporter [Betaproteobacteria bacterium]|nr:nickel transporter [Betaproteobacteria bacterium]